MSREAGGIACQLPCRPFVVQGPPLLHRGFVADRQQCGQAGMPLPRGQFQDAQAASWLQPAQRQCAAWRSPRPTCRSSLRSSVASLLPSSTITALSELTSWRTPPCTQLAARHHSPCAHQRGRAPPAHSTITVRCVLTSGHTTPSARCCHADVQRNIWAPAAWRSLDLGLMMESRQAGRQTGRPAAALLLAGGLYPLQILFFNL